jgi:nitronate monooxygenase
VARVTLPMLLQGRLSIPVIGSPMFIVSNPKLVIAQCTAGIVGSFPALNARPAEQLEAWLTEITGELQAWNAAHPSLPAAPFAVNQIVHRSNDRLEHDLEVCARFKVPITITSLGARREINDGIHACGGIVLHDIINNTFAHKAIEKGADGLIAVAAGAGGHAGTLSPFALVDEIREWFDGPLILSGAISNGRSILATEALGADLAYVGSAFIATDEANAPRAYKEAIIASRAEDIVYTSLFSGVHGNYLRASIINAGFDPDHLPESDPTKMNFGSGGSAAKKAWRDIWSAGQGLAAIKSVTSTAEFVLRLTREYDEARARLGAAPRVEPDARRGVRDAGIVASTPPRIDG